MVVIRLARGGSKKRPFYTIVAADKRCRRDGRFIERLGFYTPMASGQTEALRVEFDRVAYWTGVGAQISPTVQRLIKQAGGSLTPATKAKAAKEVSAEATAEEAPAKKTATKKPAADKAE